MIYNTKVIISNKEITRKERKIKIRRNSNDVEIENKYDRKYIVCLLSGVLCIVEKRDEIISKDKQS